MNRKRRTGLCLCLAAALFLTAAPAEEAPLYARIIQKMEARSGPSAAYDGMGTYFLEGRDIRVLCRAYDSASGRWWVKCEVPYLREIRTVWAPYDCFDRASLPLDRLPEGEAPIPPPAQSAAAAPAADLGYTVPDEPDAPRGTGFVPDPDEREPWGPSIPAWPESGAAVPANGAYEDSEGASSTAVSVVSHYYNDMNQLWFMVQMSDGTVQPMRSDRLPLDPMMGFPDDPELARMFMENNSFTLYARVILREMPGGDARRLKTLKKAGAVLTLLGTAYDEMEQLWFMVRTSDGIIGYVPYDAIGFYEEAGSGESIKEGEGLLHDSGEGMSTQADPGYGTFSDSFDGGGGFSEGSGGGGKK